MTAPTSTELHKAERTYRRAAEKAEAARLKRNELVCAALAAGWTHQAIADHTGLTRGRINQIRVGCAEVERLLSTASSEGEGS